MYSAPSPLQYAAPLDTQQYGYAPYSTHSTPYATAYHTGIATQPTSYMPYPRQHNPYSQAVFQDSYTRGMSLSPIRAHKAPAAAPRASHPPSTVAHAPAVPHHDSNQPVSTADLLLHAGQFDVLARTPTGSSFIQAALKEGCDPANIALVWAELEPSLVELLLDAHGCYVLKSLMERLDEATLYRVIDLIAKDEQLWFSMCTHSLHTRRVAQFLIERDVNFMGHMLVHKCREIGMTQQGCIIMQKAMDVAAAPLREALFDAVITNFVDFALDPFANYIVQHLLELGGDLQPEAILQALRGRVNTLSCNKYASNVIEKCLFHFPAEAQHAMINEMYNVDEEVLFQMLQDSFGNYIIQSSIALASFRDIWMISEKLRTVLQRTPYGHKIEARLERRLKGKSVLSRGKPQHPPQRGRQNHRGGRSEYASPQEPW